MGPEPVDLVGLVDRRVPGHVLHREQPERDLECAKCQQQPGGHPDDLEREGRVGACH